MEIHQTNHPKRLEHKNVRPYLDNPHTGEIHNEVLANLADVLKITQAKNVLEVGFNRGSSSLAFLIVDENLFVTSIDIIYKPKSVSTLNLLFSGRFEFIQMNSCDLLNNKKFKDRFDLIFIDGNHERAWLQTDTDAVLSLNPRFILYDDYAANKKDFSDIVLINPRLKIIKEYGTDQGQLLLFVLPE